MVDFVCLPSLNLEEVQISALSGIYPDGRDGNHWFYCRLPASDPRAIRVLDTLAGWGMTPWTDKSRDMQPNEYRLRLEREYDAADLDACELLEVRPPGEACNMGALFRSEGLMMIPADHHPDGPHDVFFGVPNTNLYITRRTAEILASSGLRGVRLLPTIRVPPMAGGGLLEGEASPYRELDSDLVMPPLSPSMTFFNADGRPVRHGDYANGFHRRDGLQLMPELRYRASDLAAAAPFDLARTQEPFGNRTGYDPEFRPLVASRRFYRFCVDRRLRVGWLPVRIEPG